jgi:hypothetical protein
MTRKLITTAEIKTEILNFWHELEESAHPEDLLTELAESYVPIYYNETISQWTELSDGDSNMFWEIRSEIKSGTTIYDLMRDDLYLYLTREFADVYQSELEKREAN